jgi:membrane protein YdbS with pleckstrin-like domain
MNEETPKPEVTEKNKQQSTFKMSSTLFVFYIIVLVVAAGLFVFSDSLAIILATTVIAVLIIIMLLTRFVFTSVTVSENGIDYRMGWLNSTLKQIPFDKINTVDSFVSVYGKILSFGTVKVYSGNDVEGILFKGMEKPNTLCRMIEDGVAEAEDAKKITATSAIDPADEIEKLHKLRDEGAITDVEFQAKKKQLLNL